MLSTERTRLIAMAFKFAVLTPTSAIDRLTNNDPTLTICDLSKSAVRASPPRAC